MEITGKHELVVPARTEIDADGKTAQVVERLHLGALPRAQAEDVDSRLQAGMTPQTLTQLLAIGPVIFTQVEVAELRLLMPDIFVVGGVFALLEAVGVRSGSPAIAGAGLEK